jgi:hypothetical protein
MAAVHDGFAINNFALERSHDRAVNDEKHIANRPDGEAFMLK